MDDLISRAAAIDALGECPYNWNDDPEEIQAVNDWEDMLAKLEKLPAVDAAPVVHGRLIKHEPDMHGTEPVECSACNYLFGRLYPQNYCPNCGAKLDADQHLVFADQSGAEYADNPTV